MTEDTPVATRSIVGTMLNLTFLRRLDIVCDRALAGDPQAVTTLRDAIIAVVADHEACLSEASLCPELAMLFDKFDLSLTRITPEGTPA